MKKYVKLADDPTFYLVEDGKLVQPIHSPYEMREIGLLPVEVVDGDMLAGLDAIDVPGSVPDAVIEDESPSGDDEEGS